MNSNIAVERVQILPINDRHIESFHSALDAVAKERKYLTLLQAFSLEETMAFVSGMINQGNPQYVAVIDEVVVGWCDISRSDSSVEDHIGRLGMGVMRQHRGRGLGSELLDAALSKAWEIGLSRIELSVYADNAAAIHLYKKAGFNLEGLHKRSAKIDGRFIDTCSMALLHEV